MKKTVYLHIGMPKTGTSSIQRFMYENRDVLEKKGVCYPPVLCQGEGIAVTPPEVIANLKLLFWKTLSHFYKDILGEKKRMYECWHNDYMPLINSSSAPTVILSAEEFLSNSDTSYLPYLFDMIREDFDLKVIAYLRKPAEYVVSLWGELLKVHKDNAITSQFAQWISQEMPSNWIIRPIPYENLYYIIKLLGAENVIIKAFERCQFKDGDLIDDILGILGVERDDDFKVLKPENESYGRNSCELALLVNKLGLPAAKREELHSLLSSNKDDLKLIDTLSDECIEQITDKYSETLKGLARIYNKDSFFASDYPACYKKDRPAYNSVSFSLEELKFLHDAIDSSNKAFKEYDFLMHDSRLFIKMKYLVYRVMCNLVPRKALDACKIKRDFYKQMLID